MSLFPYTIEVWAFAYDGKYRAQIDKFCKRAEKYGYTNNRVLPLWSKQNSRTFPGIFKFVELFQGLGI